MKKQQIVLGMLVLLLAACNREAEIFPDGSADLRCRLESMLNLDNNVEVLRIDYNSDDRVSRIVQKSDEGDDTQTYQLTYEGNRIVRASVSPGQEGPFNYDFTYENDRIQLMKMNLQGFPTLVNEFRFFYSADGKLERILNRGNFVDDTGLTRDVANVTFTWEGDNVSRLRLELAFDFIFFENPQIEAMSLLGREEKSLLQKEAMRTGATEEFVITYNYRYDAEQNPMRVLPIFSPNPDMISGWISRNNVTSTTLNVQIDGLPFPLTFTSNASYEYQRRGFPIQTEVTGTFPNFDTGGIEDFTDKYTFSYTNCR